MLEGDQDPSGGFRAELVPSSRKINAERRARNEAQVIIDIYYKIFVEFDKLPRSRNLFNFLIHIMKYFCSIHMHYMQHFIIYVYIPTIYYLKTKYLKIYIKILTLTLILM